MKVGNEGCKMGVLHGYKNRYHLPDGFGFLIA